MAKRKRLAPARPVDLEAPRGAPETKSGFPLRPDPSIAQVASEAASTAALADLADEVRGARWRRLVQDLPMDAVDETYLMRDRMLADDEELVNSYKKKALTEKLETKKVSSAGSSQRLQAARGIWIEKTKGRLSLCGPGVTDAFAADLQRWLHARRS